jgi:SAM-dependent methyltransferase
MSFYRAFEDRHRGPRETIKSRLRVYLPFLHGVMQLHPQKGTVTDLGCGRGEWLELLSTEGIKAQGVDLDDGMLQACRDLGLDVQKGDAVAFLKSLADNSQMAVCGFHIAEHLKFDVLQVLVAEALRVLRPGGLLILETPNPENLVVGTSGFYVDPTHERPLPPVLLGFLPELLGYSRIKTLRLQEGAIARNNAPTTLIDVLAGVSPDYAIVAQKSPIDSTAVAAQLDAAFAADYGVTLHRLCERYDQQAADRLRQMELRLLEALQTQAQLYSAHWRSRSSRATRALRWASHQLSAMREQGVAERLRRFVRKLVRAGIRLAVQAVEQFPLAGQIAGKGLRTVGLGKLAQRVRCRLGAHSALALTPAARRVHEAIKRSAAAHGGKHEEKEP